ncbi:MAG: hypothetical protein L6V82_07245 [Clostridiales bacterium]|nr:MAG: hypothetical protein L6V82_07245 [Clostridiales bacterium]
MEGKDVIIEKILSDARQEADKIVAEANDYATATLDKARRRQRKKFPLPKKPPKPRASNTSVVA